MVDTCLLNHLYNKDAIECDNKKTNKRIIYFYEEPITNFQFNLNNDCMFLCTISKSAFLSNEYECKIINFKWVHVHRQNIENS